MKELENLNLSENDFKLITDGLEALPSKNMAGEMMGDLLVGMLSKNDPQGQSEFELERKKMKARAEREKQLLVEEVRILQGKIFMLQRYMRMNGLLKEATEIINK
jgi:hypothetical protein